MRGVSCSYNADSAAGVCILQQYFDDAVRAWNPNASLSSGSIDSCGFPLSPTGVGFGRRTTCFHEDFSEGFDDSSLLVAQMKSCCAQVLSELCTR